MIEICTVMEFDSSAGVLIVKTASFGFRFETNINQCFKPPDALEDEFELNWVCMESEDVTCIPNSIMCFFRNGEIVGWTNIESWDLYQQSFCEYHEIDDSAERIHPNTIMRTYGPSVA